MTDFSKIEPRPTLPMDADRETAAGQLVDAMIADNMLQATERADAIRDIVRHGSRVMDGYELAKALDRYAYWDCDLRMAEELDQYSGLLDAAVRRRQAEWADRNHVQPPFPIGSHVIARWGNEEIRGVLHEVYSHGPAQYTLTREGESNPTRRAIVYFEAVRLAETEPAA